MRFYAHTSENSDKASWQPLQKHLENVAIKSQEFAEVFGAGKLGYVAGLFHDIGKYSKEFQQRLEGKKIKVDHSTAGAKEMEKKYGSFIGRALAYVIAGHHGGLPNGNKGNEKNLLSRLEKDELPEYQDFRSEVELLELLKKDILTLPNPKTKETQAFSMAFFIRMLYSSLVDADYIDTEKFMSPDKASHRIEKPDIRELLLQFEITLDALRKRSEKNNLKINNARQKILSRCIEMASCKPGFFTLTVPTGGGKTYSSLAFALNHAAKHNKKRVIYVIPYTSIIEQNAQVFRDALGDNAVLEHHSNFDYPEENFDSWSNDEKRHRLASENWDMPLVTTTSVQFFESLFSSRGSRCRKLHNIANSVIILDEAQMMPIDYLRPCLWALVELVLNYNVSVVLCTATQPAIGEMLPGNIELVEIMENPHELQEVFKRVQIKYIGDKEDEIIAQELADLKQVLCVVNTRKHSSRLFEKLVQKTDEGVYHLSARMCPAHRKEVLSEIRYKLKSNEPCRVISTQLIEAGVDVDFPVVYRSIAGVDSIAQAAGRCNREGKLDTGEVYIFEPESHGMPKKGRFEKNASITRSVQRRFNNELLSLEAIKYYFEELLDYEQNALDAKGILRTFKEGESELLFPFEDISNNFNLIEDIMHIIIVPYNDEAKKLMYEVEKSIFPAAYARRLQKYAVQIYTFERDALIKEGAIRNEKIGGLYWFVEDSSFYDKLTGLKDAKEVKAPNEFLLF